MSPKKKVSPKKLTKIQEQTNRFLKLIPEIAKLKKTADFAQYFQPGEDFYNQGAQGKGDRPSLQHLKAMGNKTVGVGYRVTREVAEAVVRNQFVFVESGDSTSKEVERTDIFNWFEEIDFWNETSDALTYERQYGSAYSVKYWNDDLSDDLSKEAPEGPWKRMQTLPPTVMSPTNTHLSPGLEHDPLTWKFQGGARNPTKVHESRVHIWRTRPVPNEVLGLSVFEPIWTSLMSYYNIIIYLVKGIAKWGNQVPVIKMGTNEPDTKFYQEFMGLVEQFIANSFFLVARDDSVEFNNPNLGQGLTEVMEIIKEDISSGVSIPLNFLFGRSESGGIGGEGALTAERNYLQTLAHIQQSITDDILRMCEQAGFDMKGLTIRWNLSLQKTSEQKIQEEMLETQRDMLAEQFKQMKIQTKILKQQAQQQEIQTVGMMMSLTGDEKDGEEDTSEQTPDEDGDGHISDDEMRRVTKKPTGTTDFVIEDLYSKFKIENAAWMVKLAEMRRHV